MTTLTADATREQMLQFAANGNSYQFLSLACHYLHACPEDYEVRLLAIREYLSLKLVGPARDLLSSESLIPEQQAELRTAAESIRNSGCDVIPWSDYSRRYQANLATLDQRGIDTRPIREAWEAQATLHELYIDANGISQIRRRSPDGQWQWVSLLGDHRALAEAHDLSSSLETNFPGPFVFDGIDLGWTFQRVYKATLNSYLTYSCPLYIIEHNPTQFALALHLHDWANLLADPRIFLFVGESGTQEFRQTLMESYNLPIPIQCFIAAEGQSPAGPNPAGTAEEIFEHRERQSTQSFHELEALYAQCDLAYWANRFDEALSGRGAPLRILAAVSMHTTFLQHSMRDAQRAFESLGHECVVLKEQTSYEVIGPFHYQEKMRNLKPDLFFNIDHVRPEFGPLIPDNLPILTWDQDQLPHVVTKENLQQVAKHDFLAGYSKSPFLAAGGHPNQAINSIVPTCPEQFDGEPLSDKELAQFTCDVSFVSHASQTPKAFHEQERSELPDASQKRFLDTIFEITCERLTKHATMRGGLGERILDEACQRTGQNILNQEQRNHLQSWYLWRLGDRIFRHDALQWVSQWAAQNDKTLRVYGNGWDQHPTLSDFAAGPVENGRALLCVYRASKINLQLMPAGFIHQRALDGLAAGGFFLTRMVPHDHKGKTLRQLILRMQTLKIHCTQDLFNTNDDCVKELLSDYLLEPFDWVKQKQQDVFTNLQIASELDHPDEVFPRFNEIVFNSPEEFARLADQYLFDNSQRQELSTEMRQVVLDRFSYRATMHRFLHAMKDYLREVAS